MGTPEFAVPSLEILVKAGVNIVGVITAADTPKGRGLQLAKSPVKEYAESQSLRILQPTNLKSPKFQEELKDLKGNLQVIVAFRMLPKEVWSMPEMGSFNLHASLLPQYRGAAPINWAIINGETETGLTTFFLKHEIDTGNIIYQEKEKITPTDTAGTLYKRLMHKGAHLVLKTVKAIETRKYEVKKQNENTEVKLAPKIFKETCKIDWKKNANVIYNHIRGLSPYPAAWTIIDSKSLKIFEAQIIDKATNLEPGSFETDNKSYLYFKTGDRFISVKELQMQGKKRMSIENFLRGNKLSHDQYHHSRSRY